MDGRLVHAGVRGAAAHRRAASVTASGGAARCSSASCVFGLGSLAVGARRQRRTSSSRRGRSWASAARSSCRRRCRSSPTCSRAHERGKAIGVWAGDRRARRRARPAHRRVPARALLLGLDLPREHPDRRSSGCSRACSSSRRRRTRRRRGSTRSARCSRSSGLTVLLYAIIEAPTDGWTDPTILACVRRRRRVARRVRPVGVAHRPPDARRAVLQEPALHRGELGDHAVFFAMFGSIFLLTQYFQFVLGYSPLETGVRFLPSALTMMVVAPLSARIVAPHRHQARRRQPACAGRHSGWSRWSPAADRQPRTGPTSSGGMVAHGDAAWRSPWRPPPSRSWARCRWQGRRRLGGERHHPPGRRRARRRDHRQRAGVDLRLAGRRLPAREAGADAAPRTSSSSRWARLALASGAPAVPTSPRRWPAPPSTASSTACTRACSSPPPPRSSAP